MTDTTPHASGTGTSRSHLEPLAEALRRSGFLVKITRIGGGPCFAEVVNRTAPELTESIFAAKSDGEWWFWWSWAERIAPAHDVEFTAGKIARVLATVAA